jgi:hypothetical protein
MILLLQIASPNRERTGWERNCMVGSQKYAPLAGERREK